MKKRGRSLPIHAIESGLQDFRRPLNLSRPVNLTLVGTSRCDAPAREAAGGIVAPLNAARTAQRAVPTRFRGSMRENLFRRIHFLILSE